MPRKLDRLNLKRLAEAHAQADEALEQQTATSEILQVISSSPTDVEPVLDAVAESAARLCDSMDAQIFRVDGDVLRVAASHGQIPMLGSGEGIPMLGRGTLAIANKERFMSIICKRPRLNSRWVLSLREGSGIEPP